MYSAHLQTDMGKGWTRFSIRNVFLISNNLSAPLFETNVAEQEKKRQLLSYLSGGIEIPNFLIQHEFNKENQTFSQKKFSELRLIKIC